MAYYGNAIYDTSQPAPGSMDQSWMQQQQQPSMYQGQGDMQGGMPMGEGGRHMSRTTVYVGGLSDGADAASGAVDEAAVYNFFFSRCGPIRSIRMQANRGFCFIDFESEAAAGTAVSLNGTFVVLRPESPATTRIMVRYAYDRPARSLPQQAAATGGAYSSGGSHPNGAAAMSGWPSDPTGASGGMGAYSWDNAGGSASGAGWSQGMDASAWQQGWEGGWDAYGGGGYGGGGYPPSGYQSAPPQARPRSPSPPRFSRYSDSENRALKELLKRDLSEIELADQAADASGVDHRRVTSGIAPGTGPAGGSLLRAVSLIVHWMETGECDKKTADNFYAYLCCLRSKLQELQAMNTERTRQRQHEDIAHMAGMVAKCDAIHKAFQSASKQKVMDKFSKVQRKNVDKWATGSTDVVERVRQLMQTKCAVAEVNMELAVSASDDEADGSDDDAKMDTTASAPQQAASKPPPPPSTVGVTLVPPPLQESAESVGGKRPRTDQGGEAEAADAAPAKDLVMDLLSSRIAQLERMLMEKLSGSADKQDADKKVPQAETLREAAGGPVPPVHETLPAAEGMTKVTLPDAEGIAGSEKDAKDEANLSAEPSPPHQVVDPATACAVSAISVHLASFPDGATLQQLCTFLSIITKHTASSSRIEQLALAALHFSPGIFSEVQHDGSSEVVWCLNAFKSLPGLLK